MKRKNEDWYISDKKINKIKKKVRRKEKRNRVKKNDNDI